MARLRRQSPTGAGSADEFCSNTSSQASTAKTRTSPRKKAQISRTDNDSTLDDMLENLQNLEIKKPEADASPRKKQVRLAPLKSLESSNELRLRVSPAKSARRPLIDLVLSPPRASARSPRKREEAKAKTPDSEVLEEEVYEAEIEQSIWCGSDASGSDSSEDELPSPRKLWFNTKPKDAPLPRRNSPPSLSRTIRSLQDLSLNNASDPEAPKIPPRPLWQAQVGSRPASSSSDKENFDAILRFSPPRLHTRPERQREQTPERPVTPPPLSPSKSKLVSPSKSRFKIPTPPHRQSLDGFWDAQNVNEWNDQYSPQKVLKSPKKNRFLQLDEPSSPTASPKKSQSPAKRSKAEVLAKKSFEARKHKLAESFLEELDQEVTSGQVQRLAASTGGVRFIWSKTLNSTAGRANWRRETTRTREPDGTTTTTHAHHASIELAEKVIDDELRLLNVVAHEFCHLANFMVSGIKDQPHGAQFKAWGRKCTAAFAERGVEVTTKHSYQIDYKYIWQCSSEECLAEFKRHSKSIDPKRHTCGSCRGKLVQVKPAPRAKAAAAGAKGEPTGYAAFVKVHFADVKRELPAGTSHKEVMEAVGRRYRAEKEAGALPAKASKISDDLRRVGEVDEMEKMSRALEVVVLDD